MDRIASLFGVSFKPGQGASPMIGGARHPKRTERKEYHQPERFSPMDDVNVPDTRTLKRGEILFKEGDPSGCAYYVESGEVEIVVSSRYGHSIVNSAKSGEIVGEMGVIDHLPRNASAIARGQTVVRVIERAALNKIFDGADPATRALLTLMMNRLRATTEKLASGHA